MRQMQMEQDLDQLIAELQASSTMAAPARPMDGEPALSENVMVHPAGDPVAGPQGVEQHCQALSDMISDIARTSIHIPGSDPALESATPAHRVNQCHGRISQIHDRVSECHEKVSQSHNRGHLCRQGRTRSPPLTSSSPAIRPSALSAVGVSRPSPSLSPAHKDWPSAPETLSELERGLTEVNSRHAG
eukprot:TRINITY_DN9768_c0_g1_i1.p1 TRINITY_DN9768_c0_g1~~TRINITY_DN9768_c0_g1_i1.p1  ORF type:complete len:188 (+),score=19.46 TRINITY_DN9768_c0_g1_i1:251-814(+)